MIGPSSPRSLCALSDWLSVNSNRATERSRADGSWDLRGSVHRWFPRAKRMPRSQTTLHGDWHKGNLFYRPEAVEAGGGVGIEDIVAIDWAMLGTLKTTQRSLSGLPRPFQDDGDSCRLAARR